MNTISIPRLGLQMTHDPDVIICSEVLNKAAETILTEADSDGFYNGEFSVEECDQDVDFSVNCQLFYSPFKEDNKVITGVLFYSCFVDTYDEDGNIMTNDFTETEFESYLKGR